MVNERVPKDNHIPEGLDYKKSQEQLSHASRFDLLTRT